MARGLELTTETIQHWLDSPIESAPFLLALTIAAFYLSNLAYRATQSFPFLHPTVAGAVLVAATLPLLEVNYARYIDANQALMFLLGPATVALAIPLYQQLPLIRKMALPILITCITGACFAAGVALVIAALLGAEQTVLLSLAPKSVTTPIAISVANEIGGIASLAAGAVAITAVLSIFFAPYVFKWLGIDDPAQWGFCLGITGHGMGTARAFEINAQAGAFASLAMCLTGTFSAVIIPISFSLLR